MKNKPFIIHPSPASHHDAKKLEQRRLKAATLFKKGIHQAEIARRLKVSRPAVHYWYITWEKKGKDGLRRTQPGPKSQLTGEKLAKVKRTLAKGPLAAGYDTNLWTLARIADVIRKKTRVSYGTSQVWYLLRSLGWSSQKPETRYRDRNEAAIKRWKEESWPRIQKRGQRPMPA
jgi:transposase